MELGCLYYNGCSISQHVDFGTRDEPVYTYRHNIDGQWIEYPESTLKMALLHQKWDYVVLQSAKGDLTDDLIHRYGFNAQFTGQKITEVGIDTVPTQLRQAQFQQFGDLQVTQEMRQTIINAANYSLDHPWDIMHK